MDTERKLKKPEETERKLNAIFHRLDRAELAKVWSVDTSTVSKRLNGELRMNLPEIAAVLDMEGVQLTGPGQVVADADELNFLRKFYGRQVLEGDQ